ncbi:MAG TPA: hypothetical protein VGU69_04260, partial [Rhizomicrobium sp.]|nr:hypothetical protein [Rhizomicrobium sp.]
MNASANTWLDERRAEAENRFRALGVPHRRIEDWKYSDLKNAIGTANDDAAAVWAVEALPEDVELFDLSKSKAPDWVK